jgi:hypothetical protein
MKSLVFIIVVLLTVPAFAADKKKQHKDTIDLSCPNGIEDITKLSMTNPYDNRDRCFEYIGKTVKLLNKNQALYSYFTDDRPVSIIDFGEESASVTFYGGLVKGVGAFVYKTIDGGQNIIHFLVAIPKDKADKIKEKIGLDKQ